MSSRVMEFLTSVPIITRCLLAINVSIHVLVFLTSWPIDSFTMSPWFVLYRGEYYRVMSSVFLHAGILHLFMNMSTLIAIGPSLEHHFGSLKMLLITLWTILLGGIFFVFIVW
jgi:rhomboid protease GluP